MLGNREVCGADRSMIKRFFPRKFSSGNADGADAKKLKRGCIERADHKTGFDFFFDQISYYIWYCKCRSSQIMFLERGHVTPGLKPSSRPESRRLVKLVSGWWDNSVES